MFKTMQWMTAVVLLAGFSMTAMAQPADGNAPRVAVVDLDAVAKAVGRDQVIRQQIDQATQQLNQELLKAANEMKQQIETERKQIGESPSEEDQKRLQQMVARASQNVQNNKLAARYRQQQLRNQLIVQFRNQVRPMAEQAARKQGANLVFVASDNTVLWFDPTVDITDEVIAAYRANPPKPAPLPTPKAESEADDKPTIDTPTEDAK